MTHWATEFYANKTVVVIGGTSGIGHAIAGAFRDAGAVVHATGATDAEVAAATGKGIAFTRLDVRDMAAITAYANSFTATAAVVDCAGVNLRTAELTPEGFETTIDINLNGTMRVAYAFRPRLAGGAFLGIGSMFSFFGAPHAPAYAASKGAVVQLVKSLAIAFANENIRVNAVSPGLIWREGLDEGWPEGVRAYTAATPLGRLGRFDDVADACLFLASPQASYVSGANLVIDGGGERPAFLDAASVNRG